MAHDVFISYSSADKVIADALCAHLEARRFRCWIAPRDVLPGMEYAQAIVEGIEACRTFIVVFSSEANASPQVRREVERAVSKEKIILPFRIENVRPSKSMEFCLSSTHWLDAMTPPMEAHLTRLGDSVARLLESSGEDRAPEAAHAQKLARDDREVGFEFRSDVTFFGLPLLHIAFGQPFRDGRAQAARGIVAIGDRARGVLAIGTVAIGLVPMGTLAIGVFPFGLVSIGLCATGALAVAGAVSYGVVSIAPYALGCIAVGHLCRGGFTLGSAVWNNSVKESAAEAFFAPWVSYLTHAVLIAMSVLAYVAHKGSWYITQKIAAHLRRSRA